MNLSPIEETLRGVWTEKCFEELAHDQAKYEAYPYLQTNRGTCIDPMYAANLFQYYS